MVESIISEVVLANCNFALEVLSIDKGLLIVAIKLDEFGHMYELKHFSEALLYQLLHLDELGSTEELKCLPSCF